MKNKELYNYIFLRSMSTMIIFTMYFVLQGKDLTIKVILMIVLGKYFNVHQPPKKL